MFDLERDSAIDASIMALTALSVIKEIMGTSLICSP